jgi:hypothetical protein
MNASASSELISMRWAKTSIRGRGRPRRARRSRSPGRPARLAPPQPTSRRARSRCGSVFGKLLHDEFELGAVSATRRLREPKKRSSGIRPVCQMMVAQPLAAARSATAARSRSPCRHSGCHTGGNEPLASDRYRPRLCENSDALLQRRIFASNLAHNENQRCSRRPL